MKKKSFIIPFKSNFFKEQDPFHLVIVFFIIFFGTAIFFSIPTFYDYKKYNQQIENTINQQFKINIQNLEDITFRFIPSPHLLIKRADLKIKESEKEIISELKNVKIFFSILDFYRDDIFKIKKFEIKKANFYFNSTSLNNLIINLKKNIVSNLIIEGSTFFFKDQKKEIILISTVEKLNYKIDFINSKKILKFKGNIFDSDYDFKYLIDYDFPNIQNINLNFKNPNVVVKNKLIDNFKETSSEQKGNFEVEFLNNRNIINYQISNNKIIFSNKKTKNSNFDLDGLIQISPFYFDLNLDLKKINLLQLENLFYLFNKNKNSEYENLSGILNINFDTIDHKILNTGFLKLVFENSFINSVDEQFKLGDFANIQVIEYEYLDNIDLILQMKIKIDIINHEKFNRFLFNYKKDKILSKNVFFTYQYNTNTKKHFISQISDNGLISNSELYNFNNFKQLKNLLRDDNLFKLD